MIRRLALALALLLLALPAGAQQLTGISPIVPGTQTFNGNAILKPTTVGALPSCVAALAGAVRYVTDQNTATAYLGATTGTGTGKQTVVCNGTAWVQD